MQLVQVHVPFHGTTFSLHSLNDHYIIAVMNLEIITVRMKEGVINFEQEIGFVHVRWKILQRIFSCGCNRRRSWKLAVILYNGGSDLKYLSFLSLGAMMFKFSSDDWENEPSFPLWHCVQILASLWCTWRPDVSESLGIIMCLMKRPCSSSKPWPWGVAVTFTNWP